MKRILTILTAALAAGCARPAYIAKSDAGNAYMRGHVRQVRESLYNVPEERHDSTGTPGMVLDTYTVLEYNRAGNIATMETFAGPDRVPVSREEYSYDPSGERLERSVSRNLVKRTYSTLDYEYDDRGRLVGHGNKLWPGRTELGYDRRGYPRTETVYRTADTISVKVRFRYDRHGRLRRSKPVRGFETTRRYSYHPDGTIAAIRTGKRDFDTYNEHGFLASATSIVERREPGTDRRPKGRLIERLPVTLTAEYELDSLGNWIRRVQLYRGEVQSIAVREIEYYDQ
jgi:hypothetical protein